MVKPAAEKIEDFFGQFSHKVYKKGEILIRADENPPCIFYVLKGSVKQYSISPKGEEVIVNIFKPISFFPMSWAINGMSNQYFFETTSNVESWEAPKEQVVEFLHKEPDVMYDLLSRVYSGTDGLLQRLVYLMSERAQKRLLIEISILAKRFGNAEDRKVIIKISEKELAALTGMTRETVSRRLKALQANSVLEFNKGTLTIFDTAKLEELL